MMSPLTAIFLSAVTREFACDTGLGDVRGALRKALDLLVHKVHVQDDFAESGGTLLEKLDATVRDCQIVVHLVGRETGSFARPDEVAALKAKYPDLEARLPPIAAALREPTGHPLSYTQWEYWLSVYHRVDALVYYLPTFDPAAPESEREGEQEALRLQRAHFAAMQMAGKDRGPIPLDEAGCPLTDRLIVRVFRALAAASGRQPSERPCLLPYEPLGELFVGRDRLLGEIRRRLADARKQGRWPRHYLHGIGGVGKTRLSVEYAHRFREDYLAVLSIGAETAERLESDLAGLVGALAIPLPGDAKAPDRVAAVKRWLATHPGWLLLIDNVDTPQARKSVAAILPQLDRGHVLLTGRFREWPGVEPLEVCVLDRPDAVRLLLDATQSGRVPAPDDAVQAHRLAEDVGDLCLALTQAAAYVARREITLVEYRRRWEANERKARDWADSLLMRYREIDDVATGEKVALSVATTWRTTFDALSPAARALLEIFSVLAPDPLPRSLLDSAVLAKRLAELANVENVDPEETFVELRDYGLITAVDEASVPALGSVHRLIQFFVRESLGAERRRLSMQASCSALCEAVPGSDGPPTWNVWRAYSPHVRVVVADLRDSTEAATLAMRLAGYCNNAALYVDAEPLLRYAYEVRSETLGKEHQASLASLYKLALLHYLAGRMAAAEPLHLSAMESRERTLGPEHPDTLESVNGVAVLFHATGRRKEAEQLYLRALAARERTIGPTHADTLKTLCNLGVLYDQSDRRVEAEPLFVRALELRELALGPEHPDTLQSVSNLACLLYETGRYEEAERLQSRALEARERTLGPEHPDTLTSIYNLALLYSDTGRDDDAERLQLRALEGKERTLGPEHPETLRSVNSLAFRLRAAGRYDEAEPLYLRALEGRERSLGSEHPDTVRSLHALADLYCDMQRYTDAERMALRVVETRERRLGSEHPQTLDARLQLARIYDAAHRLSEAEDLWRDTLEIQERTLGPDHDDALLTAHNLAVSIYNSGRRQAAERLFRQAAAGIVRTSATLGSPRPNLDLFVKNLRICWTGLGRSETQIAEGLREIGYPPPGMPAEDDRAES